MRAVRGPALVCGFLLSAPGCSSHRVTVSLMPLLIPQAKPAVRWEERFDELSPTAWRKVSVRRRTDYLPVELDGRRCLRAESRNGASILLHSVPFNPETFEWFSWSWRVDTFVKGEVLQRKDGSDASARVYVYERCFGNGPLSKVIAIGIMTDTDHTGATALAYFDDLRISRQPRSIPSSANAPSAPRR